MADALHDYRSLRDRLATIRESHGGEESVEEDETLDEMDVAWRELTADERALLDSE